MTYSVLVAGATEVDPSLLDRAIDRYRSVLEDRLGGADGVAACARAYAARTVVDTPAAQFDAATAFMFALEEAEDSALAELGDAATARFELSLL